MTVNHQNIQENISEMGLTEYIYLVNIVRRLHLVLNCFFTSIGAIIQKIQCEMHVLSETNNDTSWILLGFVLVALAGGGSLEEIPRPGCAVLGKGVDFGKFWGFRGCQFCPQHTIYQPTSMIWLKLHQAGAVVAEPPLAHFNHWCLRSIAGTRSMSVESG